MIPSASRDSTATAPICQNGPPLRVVFDLDGTMACDQHRKIFLQQQPMQWEEYFARCADDAPIWPTISIFRTMLANPEMFPSVDIWTARVATTRVVTETWLRTYVTLKPVRMLMRPANDRTNDADLKRRWLHQARKRGNAPDLVFEDRDRVVDMWRAEGVKCHQVASGAF